MSGRLRHVLLMLSADQPPYPTDEIAEHARTCAGGQVATLVTTRLLAGMTPEQSVVAFYGSAALGNRFLGWGIFVRYVPLDSPAGQAVLNQPKSVYAEQGWPKGARGLILLRDLRTANDGEGLESLDGTIEASGLSLTLGNLPRSPARIQVYYR